jgi:hypothetical protein
VYPLGRVQRLALVLQVVNQFMATEVADMVTASSVVEEQ